MPISRTVDAARPARFRRMLAAPLALALGGATALALSGCAGAPADSGDGVRVVATTTQVGDFTRELLGDDVRLTQLIQPGQSAHSFDPSAAQLLALSAADALVVNGAGLETWIDSAIDASGFDGVLIDASNGIRLETTGETGHDDHDHDHEHGDDPVPTEDGDQGGDADDLATVLPEKTAPPLEDDEAGHDDHDHDHDGGNPHIWTSVANAETMVANIADGLAAVPGIDADALAEHRADYLASLADLDAWIHAAVDQVPREQRLLVTNHDAFTYFVHEFDITFVGSVIPSFDDNAEPSAAQMDALVAEIRDTGVRAVFSENTLSAKTAETIAREAGVTVYSGPDALYGDSLGAPGTPGGTYLGSQIHNVQRIVASWGATAPELPESLAG